MKNFSLGITIGAIFKGADAFGSALSSSTRLGSKLRELNAQKINLASKFGESSIEVAKLNTSIGKVKANMMALNQIKLSTKNLEEYRNKFKSSIADKVALGASIVAPLKVAIDFESSMADVNKFANFSSNVEAKAFEKSLLSLSKTIPLSATELATISASGGQLGIAKENLLQFTTTVAKMSTAFDMSAESAGDSIAKLMNVYGLTQKQVVELGDSINYLSDTSASKAKDIVEVLGRVGGISKIFGLTTVQTGALSSAFLALGKPPEVAGTAINALLSKLSNVEGQNKSFQEGLKSLGLTAKGLKSDIEDNAQEGLINFLKVLEKVPKKDQMGILSNLFGAEYSDDIALLVGGLENYTKALKNTSDKSKYLNSMQKEFEIRSKTTANNLKLLGNSVSSIAINFGSLLLPGLNAVITPLRAVGEIVGNFVTEFPTLSKVIGTVAVGAVALSIGFSAIGYMASFVIGGLISVGGALVTLSSLFLTNPIALAVTGIAVAAITIYKYWEPIKGFFSNLWANTKTIFSNSWNKIKNIFSIVWDDIKNIFSSAISFIKTYLGWTPLGIIMNNWGIISRYFSTLWTDITKIFETSKKVMIETFNGVVDYIKIPFDAFFKYIEEKFKWISDFIKSTIGTLNSIGDTISETASSIGDTIADASYDIGKNTVNVIGDSMKAASKFFIIEDKTVPQATLKSKLEYTPLNQKTDAQAVAEQKKKAQGEVTQTNHISVVVNNPTNNIQVEKAVTKALKNQGKSLSDKEY